MSKVVVVMLPMTVNARRTFYSLRAIPSGVWALGFVSMFMDISSEMIHALLPIYLVTVLGASALTVGFIEGIAEATAAILKIFSGVLSDWLGKRKLLAVIGYGLAALTKPIFPLATGVDQSPRALLTASGREFEERRGTPLWRTLPPTTCGARASGSGNHSIRSVLLLDHSSPSA